MKKLYEILIKTNHVTVIDNFDNNFLEDIRNISSYIFCELDFITASEIQEMYDLCFNSELKSIVIINDCTKYPTFDLEFFCLHFCHYDWNNINKMVEDLK